MSTRRLRPSTRTLCSAPAARLPCLASQARNYVARKEAEAKRRQLFDEALRDFKGGKVEQALITFGACSDAEVVLLALPAAACLAAEDEVKRAVAGQQPCGMARGELVAAAAPAGCGCRYMRPVLYHSMLLPAQLVCFS